MTDETYNDMLSRVEQENEDKKRLPHVNFILKDIIRRIDR